MFAPEFDYYKASSVAEAIQMLGSHDEAKLIAGGHSLIPLLKLRLARPKTLIDIGGIAVLKGITVNQGTVRIGWSVLRVTARDRSSICNSSVNVHPFKGATNKPRFRRVPAPRQKWTISNRVVLPSPFLESPLVDSLVRSAKMTLNPG